MLNLTSSDLWANGVMFEDSVSGDSSFDIGSAIINVLTLSINNFDGRYSDYDFDGAEVVCYIGLALDDGTTEKVRICTATVVEQPEVETVTIDLTCEDNMRKFDRDYSESKLVYPATRGQIIRDACSVCGVTLLTTSFDRDDYIVQQRPADDALTFRQVLQWTVQIGCQWAKCNARGELCIGWYPEINEAELYIDNDGVLSSKDEKIKLRFSENTLQVENAVFIENGGVLSLYAVDGSGNASQIKTTYGFTPQHTDVVITGVKVTEYSDSSEDAAGSYISGTEGYVLGISDNKLIRKGDGETVASIIAEKCVGMRFRPFESGCPTDVSLEAGDVLLIADRNNKIYKTLITTTTLHPGSGQSIACNAKSAAKNSSTRYSQATQAYIDSRKLVQKEQSAREDAIKRLEGTLKDSSGFYETQIEQPDGSIITYLHDKPTLEESKNVIKFTAEAIGVSNDGGKTYPYGFFLTGELITKILYAEGINADYIDTGALTVKDSKENVIFQADINNKTVRISGDCVMIGDKSVTKAIEDVENSVAEGKNMSVYMSNEYQGIPVNSAGEITGSFPEVNTVLTAYYGTTDITNDCSYSVQKSDTVTGIWDLSTHTYTVTGLSGDSGWVDIRVTYLQTLSVTKRFTVSKLYGGQAGRYYVLEPSCSILKRDFNKVINPNTLDFNAYYIDGDTAKRMPYKGRMVIEETSDGDTWTTVYTSETDEDTVTHYLYAALTDSSGQTITDGDDTTLGIPRDVTNIRCKLYAAGGTTDMLDMQSVAIVLDVESLTAEQIVNILTNNGEWKGLYYLNGHLYLSFDAALGGILTLGGAHNGNGALILRNSSGEPIGTLDNDGLTFWDSYSEESTCYSYTGYRMTKEGVMRVEGSKSTDVSVPDVELENSGVIDFGKIYKYGAEVLLRTEIITMEVPSFSSATTRSVSKKFSKLSDATTCVAIFQGVTGAGGKINIATYSVDEDTSTISAIFSNLSNENLGGTAIFQLLQYGYIGQ